MFYFGAVPVIAATALDTGFSLENISTPRAVAAIVTAIPAVFLLSVSLFGLISYFVFLPSISHDSHLFARVHGTQILHPLTSAVLLGLGALCLSTGSGWAWSLWTGLLVVYLVQTALLVRRVSRENSPDESSGLATGTGQFVLNLILGAEVITFAAGARPLAPWKLDTLPDDTWIVDVRTKSEFYWNRLTGSENFPWGAGMIEAAKDKPKNKPVLVVCFSGHRSPAVAVMLKKLGFETVYNLNWGLLYLILLERGRKREGLFALTRPHRDPNRRGRDFKGISVGYIALEGIILVLAPIEHFVRLVQVPLVQLIVGAILVVTGLGMALLSYRALGRNFRIYAAPRRSGTLVQSGIYAWVRHPMYTGVIIMFAGYWLFWGSLLSIPLWLAFSILYVVKAAKEEQVLIERFPEYEEYRKHTGRFLPFL